MKLSKFGLLGLISLLSYRAMIVFSPLAYPGYYRMTMAVSDLFFGKFDANKKMNDNTRRVRRTQP